MTFDIIVFDEDELPNGTLGVKQHLENGVHASSRKELIGLYAMSGQKIKIVREYTENDTDSPIIQATAQDVTSVNANTNTAKNDSNFPKANADVKYFKVAGIECKLDNGKLYQKQWIRINQTESDNYRLVSDINNKIIQLNGKHIEKLSWVQVEDTTENT